MVEGSVEPFTWRAYEALLALALDRGYKFIGFADLKSNPVPHQSSILLRHDIDYDPAWIPPISDIESRLGVRSTYFWQTQSPYYQFESSATQDIVRRTMNQGHQLGLHFDANSFRTDQEIVDQVEVTARCIETEVHSSVTAVSFHMPGRRPIGHLQLQNGRLNTYSASLQNSFEYFSDSNQNWRGKDLAKALAEKALPRIHVLVHPMWWREKFTPLYTILENLATKLGKPISSILTSEQIAGLNSKDVP